MTTELKLLGLGVTYIWHNQILWSVRPFQVGATSVSPCEDTAPDLKCKSMDQVPKEVYYALQIFNSGFIFPYNKIYYRHFPHTTTFTNIGEGVNFYDTPSINY